MKNKTAVESHSLPKSALTNPIDPNHAQHLRDLLQQMLRIRHFEDKCAELYSAMKIRGFLHLYNGEEAIAVGVMQSLKPEDAIVATYREHGQALARGVPMNVVMAEMFGKLEGCCRGRGGSMHLFHKENRFYGGAFGVSKGMLQEFGAERILDTPLSESGFTGAGIGAAINGMRPIVEVMTVNFSLLAADQILNNAATYLHMSGGLFNVPLVIRMGTGGGKQLAAQHSHSLECWYAHIPGIKVLVPAVLEDARGMLWTALQDPD
ncbi:MAG: thiamine pyrophosphate-dependent enzyme, partial [Pseudanabaena sp.]